VWGKWAWGDRLKILFGPTRYVPPVHVPYLVKSETPAVGDDLLASRRDRLDPAGLSDTPGPNRGATVENCPQT
jgi:hypothetical protein